MNREKHRYEKLKQKKSIKNVLLFYFSGNKYLLNDIVFVLVG